MEVTEGKRVQTEELIMMKTRAGYFPQNSLYAMCFCGHRKLTQSDIFP